MSDGCSRVQAVKYRGEIAVMTKTGMATAIELLGGAGELVDDEAQVDLFGEAETSLGLTEAPRRSGPQGGRPRGARNRSTEEWRRHFLARYASPLIGLGEIYSRTPEQLARELGLYKRGRVPVLGPDGEYEWVEREDPEQLDLVAAFRLQVEAMQAALPYVHQKLPQAVEIRTPARGLFVVGDFGGFDGFTGDGLPLADDEENQRVIDATPIKSDDDKSDGSKNASNINGKGDENV